MEFRSALYLVPTPIGNLDDMTIRGLEVLRYVDIILAEDTRNTGVLLKHFGIRKPLKSYHIFNEHKLIKQLIANFDKGTTMAMVSDAGTPTISDPGYLLVRACLSHQVKVECLPGATAFVPALVSSGLPTDKFVFEGFLPQKKGRQMRLSTLAEEPRTMVFYESPHRIVKALKQFGEYFGMDRQVSVSRELTKYYEETINGSLAEIITHFANQKVKGEIVIIIAGK